MEGQLIPLVLVGCLIVFLAFEVGRTIGYEQAQDEMMTRQKMSKQNDRQKTIQSEG